MEPVSIAELKKHLRLTESATVSILVGSVTLTATVTDSEGQTAQNSVTGMMAAVASGTASFRGVSSSSGGQRGAEPDDVGTSE